jgi:hypothetical protein
MNNNKLIAEFMGVETTDGLVFQDNNTHEFHPIKYHTSWDWLMPVVNKCYTSNMQHPNDDITQGLIDVDIKATYQAVVEFIQEHNNQDTEAEACDMLYGVDNNQ